MHYVACSTPGTMLRIIADKIEELPEGLRPAAKQEGSAFVVTQMPEGWAVEDIAGLKASVITARQERDAAKKLAKAFEGIDPEKAGEARDALEKLAAGQLRGSKEIEEYKAGVERKFAADLAKLNEKLGKRTQELRERIISGELAPVIAKLGGSDSMEAILTLAAAHVRIEESEDGALKHSLVDKGGKPLVTKKQGSADPMGFEEFIGQLRDAPGTRGLFKASATGGSGGGSQTGGTGRAAGRNIDALSMSPAELIALGDRNGT